jgi:hypothetical protein
MNAFSRRGLVIGLGCGWMLLALGCHEASNPPTGADEPQQQIASEPQRAANDVETREGELQASKGFAAVADVLIPSDAVEKRFGSDWRTTAVGKRVRVRGKLRVHKCGPQEQCLIQGELPILTPDSIEPLDLPPPG